MEIKIFDNPTFGQIRTAGTPEEPLFCLADVCKALGLSARHVRARLDDGVVSTDTISDSLGRTQTANFVNEDGLYDVILDSRKPEARAFRKWITSDVLPTLRKTGQYRTRPMTEAEALLQSVQMLVDLERKQKQLEERTDTIGKDVDDIKGRLNNELKSYTVVGYCARNNIEVSRKEASAVGNRASRLCKKKGIPVDTMSDPRFGKVNLYPEDILKELIDNMVATRQSELVM